MCGIAGFLHASQSASESELLGTIKRMTDAVAHRGPDGSGYYIDPSNGLALGHRRLAIIDLTDAGRQPMTSHDRRWTIVFNGEIYNFEELRKTLEHQEAVTGWRGHSDTEVLLACISAWGVARTLRQANGMFAMAVWDNLERRLWLARDRMGEKPLYYGWQRGTFLFSSELKALAEHPNFERRLDRAALARYLELAYVPAPHSIYEGIFKIRPAHYITIDAHTPRGFLPRQCPYWQLPRPHAEAFEEGEALDRLGTLLKDAVAMRMRSDVPMGAFLSGGVDSTVIVALMQAQSARPVHTFSIGFQEADFDESGHAAAVAACLGTAHIGLQISAHDALDAIPTLARIYDEPFADASQIPTYLLARLTRRHVTVSLSGDAGDELFGGYARYFTFDDVWRKSRRIPASLRPVTAWLLSRLPLPIWKNLPGIPPKLRREITGPRLRKLSSAIATADRGAYYKSIMRVWDSPYILHENVSQREDAFIEVLNLDDFDDTISGMSYIDQGSYLPDDILVKLDRATMASGLEGRIPMLDHRLVEFAAKLPVALKVKDGTGKWLLRRLLDNYVPRALMERRKQGFSLPLQEWIRGPLRDWGETLLSDEGTPVAMHLDMRKLRRVWRQHQSGEDNGDRLWNALMLLSWSKEWNHI